MVAVYLLLSFLLGAIIVFIFALLDKVCNFLFDYLNRWRNG